MFGNSHSSGAGGVAASAKPADTPAAKPAAPARRAGPSAGVGILAATLEELKEDRRVQVTATGSTCHLCDKDVHCVVLKADRHMSFVKWYGYVRKSLTQDG